MVEISIIRDSRSPRPLQRRGSSALDLKIINIPLRCEDSSFVNVLGKDHH
jgi:hypothetical protein